MPQDQPLHKELIERLCASTKQGGASFTGTYEDFLNLTEEDPLKHLRTSTRYIYEMVQYFGRKPIIQYGELLFRYLLFDDPFSGGRLAVYGHDRQINEILHDFDAVSEGEANQRIIELLGPVGTGKTPIAQLLQRGIEEYSKTEQGQSLTFSWVFGAEELTNEQAIGFSQPKQREIFLTEEILEKRDEHVKLTLECLVRDHPILLLPKNIINPETGEREEFRAKYLNELFSRINDERKQKNLPPKSVPAFFLEKDPCINCQNTWNYLMKHYNNDIKKVLGHVMVHNFEYSENAGIGLASVEPTQRVGIHSLDYWDDIRVMNVLPDIKLYKFYGNLSSAARGILHIHDAYSNRGGGDHSGVLDLNVFLRIAQHQETGTTFFTLPMDLQVIMTTNLTEKATVASDPDNEKFFNRTHTLEIPRLVDFYHEMRIYQKELEAINRRCKISPYTLQLSAMFAVLTRLEYASVELKGETKDIPRFAKLTEDQKKFMQDISPYQKLWLYAAILDAKIEPDEFTDPELAQEFTQMGLEGRLSLEERQLRKRINDIPSMIKKQKKEELFDEDQKKLINHDLVNVLKSAVSYEGHYGLDSRTMQDIIKRLAQRPNQTCIGPLDLFEILEEIVSDTEGKKYNFMKMEMYDYRTEQTRERIAVKGAGEAGYYKFNTYLEYIKQFWVQEVVGVAVETITGVTEDEIIYRMSKYIQMLHVKYLGKVIQHLGAQTRLEWDENYARTIETSLNFSKEQKKIEEERNRILSIYQETKMELAEDDYMREKTKLHFRDIGGDVIDPRHVFPEITQRLLRAQNTIPFRLEDIMHTLGHYGQATWSAEPKDRKEFIEAMLKRAEKYGFHPDNARREFLYLYHKGAFKDKLNYVPPARITVAG